MVFTVRDVNDNTSHVNQSVTQITFFHMNMGSKAPSRSLKIASDLGVLALIAKVRNSVVSRIFFATKFAELRS